MPWKSTDVCSPAKRRFPLRRPWMLLNAVYWPCLRQEYAADVRVTR
jgi:hypothetical protein